MKIVLGISLLACFVVGCEKPTSQLESSNPERRLHQTIASVACALPRTNVVEETVQTVKQTEPAASDGIAPVVRSLVRELLALDAAGRLDKAALERIVARFPDGGRISSLSDLLCELVASHESQDRQAGLMLIAATHRKWTAEACDPEPDEQVGESDEPAVAEAVTEGDPGDGEPLAEETSFEELESAVVMKLMTVCLNDEEQSVRSAALDTLLNLPEEERNVLALQVLGNADSKLKIDLLSTLDDPHDESNVTLNFHGLDADEPEVRRLASDNLQTMVGRSFSSSEQAFGWWETSNGSFGQE